MEGTLALEITWTVIPFLITLVIFVWGARIFITLHTPPENAMEVYVVGKQWMWKIQHLEGQREINELHVPVGRPVKLMMTSEDVIHSFFVPAFRVKQDVVPGRYTTLWFEATKAGKYHLFCAEYCGTQHSRMIGRVVVMEPAEYQAWLSGTRRVPATRRRWRPPGRALPAARLRHLPPGRPPGRAGRTSPGCSASRSRSPTAAAWSPTRPTCASRS